MSQLTPTELLTTEPGFTNVWNMKSTGRTATATAIALLVLAFLSVCARLTARYKSKTRPGIADLLIVLALIFFAVYVGSFIRGMQTSGGTLNKFQFLPLGIVNFYKYVYVTEILFTIDITLIKLSILCFYTTVFSTPSFRKAAWGTMCLTVAWLLVFLFLVIFQCAPIHGFWNLELVAMGNATCIPFGKILIAYEVTNIIIDVVILSLPIYTIRTLQLPTSRKIALIGIFLLGGLVIIICIVRISYLANVTNSNDANTLPNGLNWSTAELSIAILCACVPTYGPLFRSPRNSTFGNTNWTSGKGNTGALSGVDDYRGGHKGLFHSHLPTDLDNNNHLTSISGDRNSVDDGNYPMDSIRVQRTIDVV